MARNTSGPVCTKAVLADGAMRIYWYAWRGGPRLSGQPGSAEFEADLKAAVQQRRLGARTGKLTGLIVAYRSSPEFADLASTTRAEWTRYLDLIHDDQSPLAIGSLPIAALADHRVKQHLLAWRDQWRATPRKADYAVQVLSAV